jgi:hypothetical protein
MGNKRQVNMITYTENCPASLYLSGPNNLPAISDIMQDGAQVIVHGLCVVKH